MDQQITASEKEIETLQINQDRAKVRLKLLEKTLRKLKAEKAKFDEIAASIHEHKGEKEAVAA